MSANMRRLSAAAVLAAFVVVAGCRSSAKDEAADVAVLCEPPSGEDGTAIFLRSYPAAAGYEILDERLKSSRWRKWLSDVDAKLSTKTGDPAAAQRRADELDAAGKSAGYGSCWAAVAVRRWIEKRSPK